MGLRSVWLSLSAAALHHHARPCLCAGSDRIRAEIEDARMRLDLPAVDYEGTMDTKLCLARRLFEMDLGTLQARAKLWDDAHGYVMARWLCTGQDERWTHTLLVRGTCRRTLDFLHSVRRTRSGFGHMRFSVTCKTSLGRRIIGSGVSTARQHQRYWGNGGLVTCSA